MVSVVDSLSLGLDLLESESERRTRIFNYEAFFYFFFKHLIELLFVVLSLVFVSEASPLC